MADQHEPQRDAGSGVPSLRLQGLDQTPPEYVNLIQVNHDAYAFRIALSRFLPPLALRPNDFESYRQEIEREGFPVEVVSQVVVAPGVLRMMINVLQGQLSNYEQQYGPIPPHETDQLGHEDNPHGS